MPTTKLFLLIASASGMIAVILGAFGAHGLKNMIAPQLLTVWQTAVQYHFYHTFALLVVALVGIHIGGSHWLNLSGYLLIVGILMFSGSLYALALGGPRWLGPITPVGGLMFILGWLSLFIAVLKTHET
jgi:Uncharacterized small membrane protein